MRTILIVDDEPSSLELMEFVLKRNHYDTFTASKASEALKWAKDHVPDMILLDFLMPDMNGMELCRLFKADPRIKHVPIIFVSALVDNKEIESGFKAGAAGYIFKPYNPQEIVKKIAEILGKPQP